jgi:hypothetical protein
MTTIATTIEVIVDRAGEARLQTQGYAGSSCRDASKLLEQALGAVRSDTPTSEMYQAHAQPQQLRQ